MLSSSSENVGVSPEAFVNAAACTEDSFFGGDVFDPKVGFVGDFVLVGSLGVDRAGLSWAVFELGAAAGGAVDRARRN